MLWKWLALGVLSLSGATAAALQSEGGGSCLNLVPPSSSATFSGLLTLQVFRGPPNYESIADGDAREEALILELPRSMCANDGEFIEPTTTFNRVHLSSYDASLRRVLNVAVGRQITVTGEAFGAETGHHHAPLVLFATAVSVR